MVFPNYGRTPENQRPMNIIEQRKNRIFISTLAAIAVTVNASQEFRYAKTHRVFRPQFVRQPLPAINPQPIAPPAYFPAQRTIIESQPFTPPERPFAIQSKAVTPERSPAPVAAAKEKPAPVPKPMRENALDLQNIALEAHATNHISTKSEISRTSDSIASTEALPKRSADIPKTQPDEAASSSKTTSSLTQGSATTPSQNSTPPPHHRFIAPFFHAVFMPVKAVWQPIKSGTAKILKRGYEAVHTSYSRTKPSKPQPANPSRSPAKQK
jgi:hypothetical protein